MIEDYFYAAFVFADYFFFFSLFRHFAASPFSKFLLSSVDYCRLFFADVFFALLFLPCQLSVIFRWWCWCFITYYLLLRCWCCAALLMLLPFIITPMLLLPALLILLSCWCFRCRRLRLFSTLSRLAPPPFHWCRLISMRYALIIFMLLFCFRRCRFHFISSFRRCRQLDISLLLLLISFICCRWCSFFCCYLPRYFALLLYAMPLFALRRVIFALLIDIWFHFFDADFAVAAWYAVSRFRCCCLRHAVDFTPRCWLISTFRALLSFSLLMLMLPFLFRWRCCRCWRRRWRRRDAAARSLSLIAIFLLLPRLSPPPLHPPLILTVTTRPSSPDSDSPWPPLTSSPSDLPASAC